MCVRPFRSERRGRREMDKRTLRVTSLRLQHSGEPPTRRMAWEARQHLLADRPRPTVLAVRRRRHRLLKQVVCGTSPRAGADPRQPRQAVHESAQHGERPSAGLSRRVLLTVNSIAAIM